MNSVEKVKLLCKERKIAISKLEKDLGFSNAYISQLKKGVFPSDRLSKIANYFNIPINSIIGDDEGIAEELTSKDKRDITIDLNRIMGEISSENNEPLYYNGVKVSDASANLLRNAIEFALTETKKENKVNITLIKTRSR